jgi:hypothetical protein
VYRHVPGINIGNKDPTMLVEPKAIPAVYECDLKACPMKSKTSLGFYFLCLSAWGCDCHFVVCS